MVKTLKRRLGKDVKFKWTSFENDAFMELGESLKNVSFIEYPTATGKYTLITDTSKYSTRYLLNQESEDGIQHRIACGEVITPSRDKTTPLPNWNYCQ